MLLCGGVTGTSLGVWTFTQLRALGQLDLMIALSYVVLLTTVGSLMFSEGLRALMRTRRGAVPPRRTHNWIHGLPLKMRFKRSKIYLSVIPVVDRRHRHRLHRRRSWASAAASSWCRS